MCEICDSEFFERFPFGVVVVSGESIVHIVGYEFLPTDNDLVLLMDELSTDEELELTDLDDVELSTVTGDVWKSTFALFTSDSVIN